MSSDNFPLTEQQLKDAGLLADGEPLDLSYVDAQALATMRKRPDLLNLSIWALQCIDLVAREEKGSPTLCPESVVSPALTFASDTTAVSQYAPTEYERASYYNGITEDGDHPVLVYRSDFDTTPFQKPSGRYAHIPVKSLRGVHGTALNRIWESVGPKIVDLMLIRKVAWSSIGAARFFTHATPGEEEKGHLGPVVVWLGVAPGSTSSDFAHEVSQEILTLLGDCGVKDVVVEWREAVLQRLGGPPLMGHVSSNNPTHHLRRFLTALLGVPLAAQGMEKEDSQGTLTLWFHENRDRNGDLSNNVYGVSNCHVLRKNTTIDYEHKGGAPRDFVRVCGVRRFQRGLDEIKQHISAHSIRASFYSQDIDGLEAENPDEVADEIADNRAKLAIENDAIRQLEGLNAEVIAYWFDLKLHRGIGYVQHAEAIKVDVKGGTRYTSDWGAFLANEAKVSGQFEGNVVDIGSKYTPEELMALFYPRGGCATTFKLPPAEGLGSEGQPCFIVGKDGNTTDLAIGRYTGVVTFTRNATGDWSRELGIYNSCLTNAKVFSAKGDSGSLVWRTKDGKGYIVGQLHSGENKGGSTRNHVTYCTPGWYLLEQIKKRFPNADFYRTTW